MNDRTWRKHSIYFSGHFLHSNKNKIKRNVLLQWIVYLMTYVEIYFCTLWDSLCFNI